MASMKRILEAAEAAGTLAVTIDAIRAGIAERDSRGITYLITPAAQSPKLAHNGGHTRVYAGVMYLRARNDGGRGNLCSAAGPECAGCYGYAGRAAMLPAINVGRQKKVDFLADNPAGFMAALIGETLALAAATPADGMTAVRLNGLSDIPWERTPAGAADSIMAALPAIQWWDYTRVPGRISKVNRPGWPANYDLTFSLGATNDRIAERALAAGLKLAVVFPARPALAGADYPKTWNGLPVINGDAHDFRFLETGPAIVALRAKGMARRDTTGWVRRLDSTGLDLARAVRFG